MKYRLNAAETVPVTLYNIAKTKRINGKDIVTYSNYIRLIPGEEYETDDEAMAKWFKAHRRKAKYTPTLANALRDNNVPFDVEFCRSCGGKIKKISYQIVEVYDE